jgi:hypothetical protein
MLPSSTVEPFRVTLVEPVAYLSDSYCIDLSGLEDYEVYDVRGFIDQESKPGNLLTKVPWKLDKDCREGDSDVIVKLEFPRLHVTSLGSGQPSGPGMAGQGRGSDGQTPPVAMGRGEPLYHTVAVLLVVGVSFKGWERRKPRGRSAEGVNNIDSTRNFGAADTFQGLRISA